MRAGKLGRLGNVLSGLFLSVPASLKDTDFGDRAPDPPLLALALPPGSLWRWHLCQPLTCTGNLWVTKLTSILQQLCCEGRKHHANPKVKNSWAVLLWVQFPADSAPHRTEGWESIFNR